MFLASNPRDSQAHRAVAEKAEAQQSALLRSFRVIFLYQPSTQNKIQQNRKSAPSPQRSVVTKCPVVCVVNNFQHISSLGL
jgi:hypothetical protein